MEIYNRLLSNPARGWEDVFKSSKKGLRETCKIIESNNESYTPCAKDVFKPWELICPENVRVVIIGMGPYYQEGVATGIPFSSRRKIEHDAAMIYKELERTYDGEDNDEEEFITPKHCRFEPWFEQGVMMFNKALTTEVGTSSCHMGLYNDLIVFTIKKLTQLNRNIIWVLMGRDAHELKTDMIGGKGFCVKVPHPSARGASQFVGSKCFQLVNATLKRLDQHPVDWRLPYKWNDELEAKYTDSILLSFIPIKLPAPKVKKTKKSIETVKGEKKIRKRIVESSDED